MGKIHLSVKIKDFVLRAERVERCAMTQKASGKTVQVRDISQIIQALVIISRTSTSADEFI